MNTDPRHPDTPKEPNPLSSNVTRITDSAAVYSVADVSRLLALSRGMTYAMVRNGEIPAKKIGDRWIIPKTRFHQWLSACVIPPITERE